ncbi:MAG: Sec-independent protein translocase protein TatB [Rhodospirillales bacterium]
MLDIGWQEIFIIGALALIVVGPKDLPRALRTAMLGVRKVKGLARDFQDGVDEMVREANLDDFKKEMEKIKQDELERDLKYGVKDNTLGLNSVKDDLNKIASGDDKKKPAGDSVAAAKPATGNSAAAKPASEPKPAATAASAEAEKPARNPVKRKTRGSAKPSAKKKTAASKADGSGA